MKKIILSSILVVVALSASAQDMYDALRYSDVNYYGSARTMGMGNAVTAIGGDVGTIGINPAGSAVAYYSQFTFSPEISVSSLTGNYSPVTRSDNFTNSYQENHAKFNLPQTAAVFNYSTGKRSGVKSFSLGMIVNTTANYNDRMSVSGINEYTSMPGAIAVASEGYNYNNINLNNNYNAFRDYPWPVVLGYNSCMTGDYEDDLYIGTNENRDDKGNIALGGPIRQGITRNHFGSKNDLVFNAGFNIDDKLFFGVNLGMPIITYQEDICYTETAQNPADFQTGFDSMKYHYHYSAEGSGVYAKLGLIWLPVQGLRIGAAFQTPTLMSITEYWNADAYTDCNLQEFCGDSYVEGDTYTYNLTTPMRFNLGLAYSIGNSFLLSADFERCDFSSMRYQEEGYDYSQFFEDVNNDIYQYAGATNELRVGAEFKPAYWCALRAGYNLKNYVSPDSEDLTSSFSVGAGYYSDDSFFMDFALRFTRYPKTWYYPYDDYCDVRSPEIGVDKLFADAVLTFGWRF